MFIKKFRRMKLILVFILLFSSANCSCRKLGDLRKAQQEDVLSMLLRGAVSSRKSCSHPEKNEVTYWLTTQKDPKLVQIKSMDQIDSNKQVIVLTHGWTGDRNVDSVKEVREAYMRRYDANLITIDYGVYVSGEYYCAYSSVQTKLAEIVGTFLCDLNKKVALDKIHIVGFSLGAHLAGLGGAFTKKHCNATIKRITGLDPAGPLFQFTRKQFRLDKTDAHFVDVIHTSQGSTGYISNLGTVDFYPNCGYCQPGCINLNNITSINEILNIPLNIITCSHERSFKLFAESINNNSFKSTSCSLCGLPTCFNDIIGKRYTYMGESCTTPQKNEEYKFETSDKPPYGLGPVEPLKKG